MSVIMNKVLRIKVNTSTEFLYPSGLLSSDSADICMPVDYAVTYWISYHETVLSHF